MPTALADDAVTEVNSTITVNVCGAGGQPAGGNGPGGQTTEACTFWVPAELKVVLKLALPAAELTTVARNGPLGGTKKVVE